MADPKTYVSIGSIVVGDVFDASYKSSLPKILKDSVTKAVKSSPKLTLDQPKDKKAKGYKLDGSLETLAPDKTGKMLKATFRLSVSIAPTNQMKSVAKGDAATQVESVAKIDAQDVSGVAAGAVESAMDDAVKYMAKNPP